MPRIASATCSITQQVTQYNPVRVEVTIEREGDESNESITDMAVAQAEIMLTTALLTRSRRRTGENVTHAPIRTLREQVGVFTRRDPLVFIHQAESRIHRQGQEPWRPPQVERLIDTAAQSQMLQEDTEIPNLPVAGTEPEESEG